LALEGNEGAKAMRRLVLAIVLIIVAATIFAIPYVVDIIEASQP
jgi:hypothetical protein